MLNTLNEFLFDGAIINARKELVGAFNQVDV